jgi:RRXRR protein
MPCHPARARELLRNKIAAVYRLKPFTINLIETTEQHNQLSLKLTLAATLSKTNWGYICKSCKRSRLSIKKQILPQSF